MKSFCSIFFFVNELILALLEKVGDTSYCISMTVFKWREMRVERNNFFFLVPLCTICYVTMDMEKGATPLLEYKKLMNIPLWYPQFSLTSFSYRCYKRHCLGIMHMLTGWPIYQSWWVMQQANKTHNMVPTLLYSSHVFCPLRDVIGGLPLGGWVVFSLYFFDCVFVCFVF